LEAIRHRYTLAGVDENKHEYTEDIDFRIGENQFRQSEILIQIGDDEVKAAM